MKIVWDERKNDRNRRKHRLDFRDAVTLFLRDDLRMEIYDDAHSDAEDRYIAIGPGSSGMILVVVYTQPEEDVLRIITARRATKTEVAGYRRRLSGRAER